MLAFRSKIMLILLTVFLFLTSQAQSEDTSVSSDPIQTISQLPQIQNSGAQIALCVSNSDLRTNERIFLALEEIKSLDFRALQVQPEETCVNSSLVQNALEQQAYVRDFLAKKKNLTLEIYKGADTKSSPNSPTDWRTKVLLTFRGATAGIIGAAATRAIRPELDRLSNKGHGENISLDEGAFIGALVDVIQRSNGEIDEGRILAIDAGASAIAGLVKTKDPNVIGAAVILTLSQVPVIQETESFLAARTAKKLDWKIPAAMIGAFYLLSRNKPNEQYIPINHLPAAGSYGILAYSMAAGTGNETAGFIIATAVSFLDEICDRVSEKCQGRFSTMDLLANTVGSYIGVKLATALPPGVLISLYRKGLALSYNRKW